MKVLMLDIDGVLNSTRTQVAFYGYPHSFSAADMVKFDPVALALVRRLCRDSGCKVVLSSSWREQFRCDEVAEALDLPVIGATPQGDYFTRGHEIAAWLERHPEVTRYAIVDDCEPMLDHQLPFFVQTDPNVGLSRTNWGTLLHILGDA